jgi:hypothetical protein
MDIVLAFSSFVALVAAWTLVSRRRAALQLVDEAEQNAA